MSVVAIVRVPIVGERHEIPSAHEQKGHVVVAGGDYGYGRVAISVDGGKAAVVDIQALRKAVDAAAEVIL